VHNLLTGTMGPPRTRPTPAAPEKPQQEQMLTEMHETLAYLKLEPQERAKQEAEPRIAEERLLKSKAEEETTRQRAEREQVSLALAAARAGHVNTVAELAERDTTIAALRRLVGENEDATTSVRAELVSTQSALQSALKNAERTAQEHEKALLAAAAKPPRVVNVPTEMGHVDPKDIVLDPRRDASGYLEAVVLKAPGRADITISINRGPNGRMKSMKAR
jgi:chromosome segregation ATPase